MFRINIFFLILSCFYPAISLYALPSDSAQKIFIKADSGIYNYKTGINIYEGNVVVDQGSTHILADKLITKKNANNVLELATAYGIKKLAHYWTLQKEGDKPMHAYANYIRFYPISSNVTLEENVYVTQGENSFRGKIIYYNNEQQTISVPPTKNARALIVYNPNSKA